MFQNHNSFLYFKICLVNLIQRFNFVFFYWEKKLVSRIKMFILIRENSIKTLNFEGFYILFLNKEICALNSEL